MIPREEITKVVADLNTDRKATVAEFLYALFKGKFIEVYLGDTYEEVRVEQISITYPAVFSGKVIGAYRECLIIEGSYIDRRHRQTKTENHLSFKPGKQIFISERAIRGLCEVDGNGIIDDIFIRSGETIALKVLGSSGDKQ
jgi:hypothetical protein